MSVTCTYARILLVFTRMLVVVLVLVIDLRYAQEPHCIIKIKSGK